MHLTLKKQWFDMIVSGEKREEYREVKPYWDARLVDSEHEFVRFRNGYRKDSPVAEFRIKGIAIGFGKPKWGAPEGVPVWIIKLGHRVE